MKQFEEWWNAVHKVPKYYSTRNVASEAFKAGYDCATKEQESKTCDKCKNFMGAGTLYNTSTGCAITGLMVRETDFCSFWEGK